MIENIRELTQIDLKAASENFCLLHRCSSWIILARIKSNTTCMCTSPREEENFWKMMHVEALELWTAFPSRVVRWNFAWPQTTLFSTHPRTSLRKASRKHKIRAAIIFPLRRAEAEEAKRNENDCSSYMGRRDCPSGNYVCTKIIFDSFRFL